MKKTLQYAIAVIAILFIVEQVIELPYLIKTCVKLPLFTLIPYLSLRPMKLKMTKAHAKWIVIIAGGVFVVILAAYFILGFLVDFDLILADFQNRMVINKPLFIVASLYTIFINAFAEELFFRGFIFQQHQSHKASLISAAMFAIYHVSIIGTWFSPWILLLVLTALFIGGLIFNYFVRRTESLLGSYIIHMTADLAIVFIGLMTLGKMLK